MKAFAFPVRNDKESFNDAIKRCATEVDNLIADEIEWSALPWWKRIFTP